MSKLGLNADAVLHYTVDTFTDPWESPETVLMLHGNAESGLAWYAWVPTLARHFRVVRPDMRGFGRSTPMPRDHAWSLDELIDDFCRLLDRLEIGRAHLVGAKLGGTIARAFAARRDDRVRTLTVVGTPAPLRAGQAGRIPALTAEIRENGTEAWARRTMAARLGGHFSPVAVEWWARYMGRTSDSTQLGFMGPIGAADIRADLPRITCPTLVITTEGSALGSVEDTRAWQETIAGSELLVLPGESYHVAATHAEAAAAATLAFLQRHSRAAV